MLDLVVEHIAHEEGVIPIPRDGHDYGSCQLKEEFTFVTVLKTHAHFWQKPGCCTKVGSVKMH